jgi:hypothetical protein
MVEYEELIGHYKKWLSLGAEKGTNARFGQWWWNQHWEKTGLQSCPELFYEKDAKKAYDYIARHFTVD